MNEHVVQGPDISTAWARAFLRVARAKGRELAPLVVTMNTAMVAPRADVRELLGDALAAAGETPVETVASTIFPNSLWNAAQPRQALFDRYERIWPRIERVRANNKGTYFQRFTAFGSTRVNQIEHVLQTYARDNHRRSALQLAVFDPAKDHTNNRQRGFPCLQQVAVVPDEDGRLSLTAFYATQTMFEKAYGNYLGLSRLGAFLAAELRMPFAGITCVASAGVMTLNKEFNRNRQDFCRQLEALVGAD